MCLCLAPYGVLGSMIRITMLQITNMFLAGGLKLLLAELKNIYHTCECREFYIEEEVMKFIPK